MGIQGSVNSPAYAFGIGGRPTHTYSASSVLGSPLRGCIYMQTDLVSLQAVIIVLVWHNRGRSVRLGWSFGHLEEYWLISRYSGKYLVRRKMLPSAYPRCLDIPGSANMDRLTRNDHSAVRRHW